MSMDRYVMMIKDLVRDMKGAIDMLYGGIAFKENQQQRLADEHLVRRKEVEYIEDLIKRDMASSFVAIGSSIDLSVAREEAISRFELTKRKMEEHLAERKKTIERINHYKAVTSTAEKLLEDLDSLRILLDRETK